MREPVEPGWAEEQHLRLFYILKKKLKTNKAESGVFIGYTNIRIMRCKNCGWPNKPNETTCAKCGSPLDISETPIDGNITYRPQPVSDGDGLKKTVMENQVFGPSVEGPIQETPTVSETVCPKCGYPMRSDVTKCPNCNYSVASSVSQSPVNDNPVSGGVYQRRPTRMAVEPDEEKPVLKQTRKPTEGVGKFNGTINPYMQNYMDEPAFVLEPIQRMNERKPIEPVEFEGSNVTLTRENTEAGNPTISSKEQAVITHNEGHWFIEDVSDQKTTFVQASQKIELHDGDITATVK